LKKKDLHAGACRNKHALNETNCLYFSNPIPVLILVAFFYFLGSDCEYNENNHGSIPVTT
jgi:hypothetical protein